MVRYFGCEWVGWVGMVIVRGWSFLGSCGRMEVYCEWRFFFIIRGIGRIGGD